MSREIQVLTGLNGASDQASFSDMMKDLAEFKISKQDDDEGWKLGERPDYDQAKLEKMTQDLSMRACVRFSRLSETCVISRKRSECLPELPALTGTGDAKLCELTVKTGSSKSFPSASTRWSSTPTRRKIS